MTAPIPYHLWQAGELATEGIKMEELVLQLLGEQALQQLGEQALQLSWTKQ